MLPSLSLIKGLHPGVILERELKRRKISKIDLAKAVGEHAQTIGQITKTRRAITPSLSLKLDRYFQAEEGYFLSLQAYYEIAQVKLEEAKLQPKPDMSILRRVVFWDSDLEKIDFVKHKRFVIERIMERGNRKEIEEIVRFYGKEEVENVIVKAHTLFYPAIENAEEFLGIAKESIQCYKDSIGKQHHSPYYTSSRK